MRSLWMKPAFDDEKREEKRGDAFSLDEASFRWKKERREEKEKVPRRVVGSKEWLSTHSALTLFHYRPLLTRSRSSLPTVKKGTRFAGIATEEPVLGLRP